MKILHVTPHLGGGVGKAHSALRGVLPNEVEQTFVLLEAPRNRRYAEMIEDRGGQVIVARNLDHVANLAAEADIVQFEFWNHPRLFECLARCAFPAIRSVFWSHISGVCEPLIPPGLMEEAMRFVFTTKASLEISAASNLAVINSGFGVPDTARRAPARDRKPAIAYLGTVDFVKMNPGFFDAIDALDREVPVSVWGAASDAVTARAQAMRHPERVQLHGETAEPTAALSHADIFFYPLQPDHYGTAENALIEAMSLGLVPVVLDNAAERAIVRHGETGFIANSIDEAASLLRMLLASPAVRERISRNAIADVAANWAPDQSARNFMVLWLGLLSKSPRRCDFVRAIGNSPAEWFAATQAMPGVKRKSSKWTTSRQPSKGTLAHFESVFGGDASLARLRR